MVPRQRVWKAGLVGVEVDSSHAWFVPTTGRPRGDDGVSEAAICQPASIALVQAVAPGSIELAGGGQGGILGLTEGLRFLEGELLKACDEEDFPWGQRQRQRDGSCVSSEKFCSYGLGAELPAPYPAHRGCSPSCVAHTAIDPSPTQSHPQGYTPLRSLGILDNRDQGLHFVLSGIFLGHLLLKKTMSELSWTELAGLPLLI